MGEETNFRDGKLMNCKSLLFNKQWCIVAKNLEQHAPAIGSHEIWVAINSP